MRSQEREETSVWKIAAGVALGILAAGVIGFFVRASMAQAALEQFKQQTEKILMQQQQGTQAARDRALAERAEQERAAAYAAAARQRAQTAATDAAMRRERAWAKYYKRPALCDDQPSNETMMKCANDHIRAKRQFDLDYEAGRL